MYSIQLLNSVMEYQNTKIKNTSEQKTRFGFKRSRIVDTLKICRLYVGISKIEALAPVTSNLSEWSYNTRRRCPFLNIDSKIKSIKQKFVINCEADVAYAYLNSTKSPGNIKQFSPDDKCLRKYVDKCCSDSLPVPNVVHYVWYNQRKLSFFHFVSFISVLRFVRPCIIMIHGNIIPSGNYWKFILNLYPNIVHVFREITSTLFGKKVKFLEHFSDIWRLKTLLRFGGIYLDTDTVLVKQIDTLRRYPCTMSRQTKNKTIGSAFIMAERNATFIREWYDWYKMNYVNTSYTYNAMKRTSIIAFRRRDLIHIEYGTVSRPDRQVGDIIFYTNTNWANIYGIHLYVRSFWKLSKYIDENTVMDFNTTVGALCRHILYGNKELCIVMP